MPTVVLNLGSQCNNACRICVDGDRRSRFKGKASRLAYLQKLQETLSRGRGAGARRAIFTGGEPSLSPHFLAAVQYAKSLGYEVLVRTNGRLFCYEASAREAVKAGVDRFEVSLHGHRAEIHEYLTGTPGSFLQTLAGIRNLIALGREVTSCTVIARPNYRHLPDTAKLLLELGVRGLRFVSLDVHRDEREVKAALIPRHEMALPWLKEAVQHVLEAGKGVAVEGIPARLLEGCGDLVLKGSPEEIIADPAYPVPAYPCAWVENDPAQSDAR